MSGEMCPSCRELHVFRVTESRRKVELPGGKTKEMLVRAYHCETCNSFIRDEDVEEVIDIPEDQSQPER